MRLCFIPFCFTLLQVLKTLVQLQLTIVAVIHQPRWEIFRLFDDLTLLASDGSVAYSGPMQVVSHVQFCGVKFNSSLPSSCSFASLSSKKWA